MRPITALPIALFALALVGNPVVGRVRGATGFMRPVPTAKLLVLPLLFYHFERSPRGLWVFVGFLASCMLLMAASWIVAFYPSALAQAVSFARALYAGRRNLSSRTTSTRARNLRSARWRWPIRS